jgi:hypothetical protein
MKCADLKRWLDEGGSPASEAAAREHASRCEGCSTLLEAQREIDVALSRNAAGTLQDHARFVERVMEQVAVAERPQNRVELWPAMSPLPWWVQAAADPAAALACALAALFVWRIDWLLVLTRFAADRWNVVAGPILVQARTLLGFDRPGVALGLELLAFMALVWTSYHLYRWSERLTRRSAGA